MSSTRDVEGPRAELPLVGPGSDHTSVQGALETFGDPRNKAYDGRCVIVARNVGALPTELFDKLAHASSEIIETRRELLNGRELGSESRRVQLGQQPRASPKSEERFLQLIRQPVLHSSELGWTCAGSHCLRLHEQHAWLAAERATAASTPPALIARSLMEVPQAASSRPMIVNADAARVA
jgi:hypothetical protein